MRIWLKQGGGFRIGSFVNHQCLCQHLCIPIARCSIGKEKAEQDLMIKVKTLC